MIKPWMSMICEVRCLLTNVRYLFVLSWIRFNPNVQFWSKFALELLGTTEQGPYRLCNLRSNRTIPKTAIHNPQLHTLVVIPSSFRLHGSHVILVAQYFRSITLTWLWRITTRFLPICVDFLVHTWYIKFQSFTHTLVDFEAHSELKIISMWQWSAKPI